MGAGYRAVGWSRQKRVYDATVAGGVVLYIVLFVGVGFALHPLATAETLIIRALGTAAFLCLTAVLAIGPLCRLDARFLPLLYNRRHFGVLTFLLGLAHGAFSIVQFHALGDMFPLVSLFASNTRYTSFVHFPFQVLGFLALAILFVMAATSHDFWLKNLTAPTWKALHMLVYVAYGLVVMHVALGVLQAETNPLFAVLLCTSLVLVLGLHGIAGWRERARDRDVASVPHVHETPAIDPLIDPHVSALARDGFVDVCAVGAIPDGRAHVATLGGERVAIFRYGGQVSALSNVCQHQNGPLGEGRVIDGCVTCPWHGYQYRPHDGCSPAPFTEKVPTFRVRVHEGRVWVDPRALAAGTAVEPATYTEAARG